jgi:methionine synthase I (cobalamin-dependent)
MSIADEKILILDGACGTSIQRMDIPDSAWDGHEGCNEYLNLSAPEAIIELHRDFIRAGAQVLETNTFGASSIVLAEYGLEKLTEDINHAAVANARAAIADRRDCYVAGSVGPTTKLPTLGHIAVSELASSLSEQIRSLLKAGVDCLIIETCQDLLQAKTGVVAAFELLEELGLRIPVLVSVTIEQSGTMLVGTDIAAVAATFEPFPIFSLGLNCATGPSNMESHIRYLRDNWPGRISCVPNAGIPEIGEGGTRYPLTPDQFARTMKRFVEEEGVSIVGGCCGTETEHIRKLVQALKNVEAADREILR